jgi:hypothetical protein
MESETSTGFSAGGLGRKANPGAMAVPSPSLACPERKDLSKPAVIFLYDAGRHPPCSACHCQPDLARGYDDDHALIPGSCAEIM